MDNYSLEEVKMLINDNMITPEVFENILKSTTRRIELYDDKDDWEILNLLSKSDIVPSNVKKDIVDYLDSYQKYKVKKSKKAKKSASQRRATTITIIIIAILLIVITALLIVFKV